MEYDVLEPEADEDTSVNDDNSKDNHEDQLPEALVNYTNYLKSLSSMSLYSEDFQFSYTKNEGLTKEEFQELCDLYDIPKGRRTGRTGYSVLVGLQQNGSVKKSVIFFARDESNNYNAIIAEAKQVRGLNISRVSAGVGIAVGVSAIVLLTVNPAAAGITFLCSSLAIAGKGVYDANSHQFEDVVLGFMMTELARLDYLVFENTTCYLKVGGEMVEIGNE